MGMVRCTWADGMQEIDDLVAEWTPEPLVAAQTAFEEAVNEKQPVIVGYEPLPIFLYSPVVRFWLPADRKQADWAEMQA